MVKGGGRGGPGTVPSKTNGRAITSDVGKPSTGHQSPPPVASDVDQDDSPSPLEEPSTTDIPLHPTESSEIEESNNASEAETEAEPLAEQVQAEVTTMMPESDAKEYSTEPPTESTSTAGQRANARPPVPPKRLSVNPSSPQHANTAVRRSISSSDTSNSPITEEGNPGGAGNRTSVKMGPPVPPKRGSVALNAAPTQQGNKAEAGNEGGSGGKVGPPVPKRSSGNPTSGSAIQQGSSVSVSTAVRRTASSDSDPKHIIHQQQVPGGTSGGPAQPTVISVLPVCERKSIKLSSDPLLKMKIASPSPKQNWDTENRKSGGVVQSAPVVLNLPPSLMMSHATDSSTPSSDAPGTLFPSFFLLFSV